MSTLKEMKKYEYFYARDRRAEGREWQLVEATREGAIEEATIELDLSRLAAEVNLIFMVEAARMREG